MKFKNLFFASALALSLVACSSTSQEATGTATETVTVSYDKALGEINLPRYEADGSKVDQPVSDVLKSHLNTDDLTAEKDDSAKTLTVNVQLKDVRRSNGYLNGISEPGLSFYDMLNFDTDVKQIQQLLADNEGYTVIDSAGNEVDQAYVDELAGLIDQIISIDTSTNLVYDRDALYDSSAFAADETLGGTDVIATSAEGNVSFKFHMDSHGWWGYDLGAHDSITGIVMGTDAEYAQENQNQLTTEYGNFFVIDMQSEGKGKWYMLNNTDLENPTIYVSADGKEAFMIDVDMYGQNVINKVINDVIGDQCESLKIFMTHNHGDHVNNLEVIAKDEHLKDIITIYWPENEPHTTKEDGTDLVTLFDDIKTLADMEKFTVADHEFQFVEIPNEHTPGGGQLADLTNKVLYSGDTLGAQVHLGGTTVFMDTPEKIDNFVAAGDKTVNYISENDIKYILGAHTPYLNTAEFGTWFKTSMDYAKDELTKDPEWKGGLVILENGEICDGERMGELFAEGLTDRQELNFFSANFINLAAPQE